MKILDSRLARWAAPAAFILAAASPSYAGKTAVVVSTASIDGETISCGCVKRDLGGIARHATVIQEVRNSEPSVLLVDAGNFGSDDDFEPWTRTAFEWQTMKKMGYDVITPGPSEMLQGLAALKDLLATAPEIQVVSANVTDKAGNPIWPPYTVVEKGGIRYGVTGVTDRAYYSFNLSRNKIASDDFEFGDISQALSRVLPELRQKSDLVVVLLHTGTGDAMRLVDDLKAADVVIVGNKPGYKFVPETVGEGTLMVRAGERGQYVSVLKLTLDDGNRIVDHSGEARPMGEAVAEEPGMKTLVDAFNKKYEAAKKEAGFVESKPLSP
jgi:2',3'-cyclic-nucleotide 2'-phosphodiesterase (5'-nucleotidase family)